MKDAIAIGERLERTLEEEIEVDPTHETQAFFSELRMRRRRIDERRARQQGRQ